MRRAPPLRVVLDTNTALSALLFTHGRLTPLRAAWQSGSLVPLLCSQTVQELLRVLAYPKFGLTPMEQEELLADYLPFGEAVPAWRKTPALPECRDPADQVFLELAEVANAQWLVTGDHDLLELRDRLRFQIIEPAKMMAELEERRE